MTDPNVLTYLSHANFHQYGVPMISGRNMVHGIGYKRATRVFFKSVWRYTIPTNRNGGGLLTVSAKFQTIIERQDSSCVSGSYGL